MSIMENHNNMKPVVSQKYDKSDHMKMDFWGKAIESS